MQTSVGSGVAAVVRVVGMAGCLGVIGFLIGRLDLSGEQEFIWQELASPGGLLSGAVACFVSRFLSDSGEKYIEGAVGTTMLVVALFAGIFGWSSMTMKEKFFWIGANALIYFVFNFAGAICQVYFFNDVKMRADQNESSERLKEFRRKQGGEDEEKK